MSKRQSSDKGGTQDRLDDTPSTRGTWPDLSGILEDRNGDGFADYLNARIYVAEDVATPDLAAAANLAARFAFETLSMNLPLGFGMDEFSEADSTVAIVIGRAAIPWTHGKTGISEAWAGGRRVVAIAMAEDANRWARNLAAADPCSHTSLLKGTSGAVGSSAGFCSLADLYTARGLLGQTPGSIVVDSLDTALWLGPDVRSPAVIDLAARLALETTGLTLPLAFPSDTDPKHPNAILIGASHPQLHRMRQDLDRAVELSPGEGQLRLVDEPHGTGVTLVVLGGDDAGETAALRYTAQQLPFVSDYGSGNLELKDIESDLHKFLSLRSAEGQFAAGLSRARRMMEGQPTTSRANTNSVAIVVDGADEDLRRYAAGDRSNPPTLRDVRSYKTTFDETVALRWEVDNARARFRETVLPHIRDGSGVSIHVQLRFRIADPKNGIRNVMGEVYEYLLEKFRVEGIEIPFPQQVLHLRGLSAPDSVKPIQVEVVENDSERKGGNTPQN